MLKTRVLPCLLLQGTGLVKTVQFRNPVYIGDPINTVRIFNTKQVDELVLLDISATKENRKPQVDLIGKIAEECLMPLTVGGGIRSLDDIRELFNAGVEKVVINSYAVTNPLFVKKAANQFGSQAIVISIDVRRHHDGSWGVFTKGGSFPTGIDPADLAVQMESVGAGEILLTSIDYDGTMRGYDIEVIKYVSDAVSIPIIACGGAGSLEDFERAVKEGGACAVAAGSFFVFHGRRKAVLINFPTKSELEAVLNGGVT